MIKYSFVIPVYNCKEYLPACVSSIRAIGVDRYEILLIDDGSTDGSAVLCDELAARFPEILVIHQENAGASAARNRGMREASGERLLFVDSDDTVDSETMREMLNDPRCDQADLVIFGLSFDYYKNGKCYRRDPLYYSCDGIMTQSHWGAVFFELYANNSLNSSCTKVFKRNIIQGNNLVQNEDMFLYEDFEFVLRYLKHCSTIWNVPKPVYHYRQTEDEGNAKRRLSRIDSIPVFLRPIEAALTGLAQANPAIPADQAARILQQLHLVLAREKISVSSLKEKQKICREFRAWAEGRDLPQKETKLQKRLMEEKALSLLLADKKSALRHKLAVWVKSHIYKV